MKTDLLTDEPILNILSKALPKEALERAKADLRIFTSGAPEALNNLTTQDLLSVEGDITDYKREAGKFLPDLYRGYLQYLRDKIDIARIYDKEEDWYSVLSEAVYCDVGSANEAFIDYVEQVYNTKVKDVEHLQELTGITHLGSYWDGSKKVEVTKEEEQKKVAKKELLATLETSKVEKYFRALTGAIDSGAIYKDLQKIEPKDYNLPETWEYFIFKNLYKDKQNAIEWAIGDQYAIFESARLMMLPSLRAVAEDIEAPYSVVMNIYKRFHGNSRD